MFTSLFDKFTENVGNSIKQIAKIIYRMQIVIAIITLVTAIIFFFQFCDDGDEEFLIYMVVCLCAFLVSVMSALLSVVLLYAFGALVDSNEKIASNTDLIIRNLQLPDDKHSVIVNESDEQKIVNNFINNVSHKKDFQSEFLDIECNNCHNKISVSKKTLLSNGSVVCPKCHNKIQ